MARRGRHRRKDMQKAMEKVKGPKGDNPPPPPDDKIEMEEIDDVHEASTKAIPEDRIKKALDEASKERQLSQEAPTESEARPVEVPEDGSTRVDKVETAPRSAPKKKKRRRRAAAAEIPETAQGLAEGFGVVTAMVCGAFCCASIVAVWKVFGAKPDDLVARPHYWWLVGAGLAASIGYMWLAVSGGGLSADWGWARTSMNATAGFLLALAMLDAFLAFSATSEAQAGDIKSSTSVAFWPVAWGVYPLLVLLFLNIPGLAGDVKPKRPKDKVPDSGSDAPEEPDESDSEEEEEDTE